MTGAIEAESRRALAAAHRVGRLLVAETAAPTASAIVDFLLPEYGGPGETDVLVATTASHGFYGSGRVIADLLALPGCWYGGNLPERGFWGAPRAAVSTADLAHRIAPLLEPGAA